MKKTLEKQESALILLKRKTKSKVIVLKNVFSIISQSLVSL